MEEGAKQHTTRAEVLRTTQEKALGLPYSLSNGGRQSCECEAKVESSSLDRTPAPRRPPWKLWSVYRAPNRRRDVTASIQPLILVPAECRVLPHT